MNYQLDVIKDGAAVNITNVVGSLDWSSSMDQLGVNMNFQYAKTKGHVDLLPGDIFTLKNNNTGRHVYTGVGVTVDQGVWVDLISSFDFAFYLNENELTIQFNDVEASDAIEMLLKKFGVPVGRIVKMTTPIDEIYKDATISDIIHDILHRVKLETGLRLFMYMDGGKLNVEKVGFKTVKAMYKPASNLAERDVIERISTDFTRTLSIKEMKNSIEVYSGAERSIRVLAKSSDPVNIKKYGLLTKVEVVEEKDESKAKNITANLLKELNKVSETSSFTLLGNDEVRAGMLLEIANEKIGLLGTYLVLSVAHSIGGNLYTMNLNVEPWFGGIT